MEPFILYIVKVNIGIAVLYSLYSLLLRKDTFFSSKRLTLLLIYVASLTYPLTDISGNISGNEQLNRMSETMILFDLPVKIIYPQSGQGQGLGIMDLIFTIYYTGMTVIGMWIIIQLTVITRNIARSRKKILFGAKIWIFPGETAPYSFFKWIILDEKTIKSPDIHEIVIHEETHATHFHSLDVLLSELMCSIGWFNPLVWLMKKEVKINLEFLADRSVLRSGCETEKYQFQILRLSYHKAAANLSNNFNFSPLKKRIQMMNKKKTPGIGFSKYILLVPAVAALVFFNSMQKAEAKEGSLISENIAAESPAQPAQDNEKIYDHVEEMPIFPGGDQALLRFIFDNLKYPKEAVDKNIEGIVKIRFVVQKDGSIGDVQVLKSVDPSLDEESVRVVKTFPQWTPGKNGGQPVNVYYNIPINFKLNRGK